MSGVDLFTTHYGYQIDRFYEALSYDNLVRPNPNPKPPDSDPPF